MNDPHERLMNEARKRFTLFAAKAFNTLHPGRPFVPTPAFMAMAYKLEQVAKGHCSRLIINVPPRSGKSIMASVALPAYVLGQDPSCRVIGVSYSGELSAKFQRDTRTVMQHPTYRRLFPGTLISGKNSETELETAHGGFRFATSVGGTMTGRGGNLIILDDLHKADEAMSAAARDRVWDWFTSSLGSRLDNKAEGAIVVVMQRLHVDDLSGRLLQLGGWDLLSIPAIADEPQLLPIGPGRTLTRDAGHILDPDREPLSALEELRRQLGSAAFEAQYQQRPVPPDGGLIKRQWLGWYDSLPVQQSDDLIVQSWDTAYKLGEQNDYSVCSTWLVRGEQAFLVDVWRDRVDYPTLVKRAIALRERHQPNFVLIEDAGSGTSLIQSLKAQGLPTRGAKSAADKVTRMSTASTLIEAGHIHLPKQAAWLDELVIELMAFPNGAHDDQVDSVSQFLNWLSERRRAGTNPAGAYTQGKFYPVFQGPVGRIRYF